MTAYTLARVVCDRIPGDDPEGCPCPARIEADTPGQARAAAQVQGWAVNIRPRGSRVGMARDYCPQHRLTEGQG